MLIQHKIFKDIHGDVYVEKQYVKEVNMGSIKQPNNIVFFEYYGGRFDENKN